MFLDLTDFFFSNFGFRCKRLNSLGLNPVVLSRASLKIFAISGRNWTESAHRFLKQCSDAGNVEACYTLGMVSSNFVVFFFLKKIYLF